MNNMDDTERELGILKGLLRVAVYLPNYILAEGVRRIIEDEQYVENASHCTNIDDILKLSPHIIITDFKVFINIPTETLSDIGAKTLILKTECMPCMTEQEILNLISRGCSGIVPECADILQLNKVIRSVAAGELWFERKYLSDLIELIKKDQTRETALSLTKRENEIVKLICKGLRNKEIMQTLNISEQAVKSHLNRIYKKTGVCDRLQLALYAVQHWLHSM